MSYNLIVNLLQSRNIIRLDIVITSNPNLKTL